MLQGLISFFFPTTYLLRKINRLATSHNYDSSNFVGQVLYPANAGNVIEKSVFEKTLLVPFEGYSFRIPQGYDKWLTQIYGDYMQYPPVEEQITHHAFKAYWQN